MRKTIQERKEEIYCDLTGKKCDWGKDYHIICFDLIGFDKVEYDECIKEAKTERRHNGLGELSDAQKEDIRNDCWKELSFEIDISGEVAVEILKFLKRKYPKAMEKYLDGMKEFDCSK